MPARPAWRPTATHHILRRRAALNRRVRRFFDERGVLEVETPALSAAGATDPALASLSATTGDGRRYWLHTSPEFPMKRLLSAGSGPIFQIARVFRDGEAGRRHNPEFTMLEWYRPGFDAGALMDEVEALAMHVGATGEKAERLPWREAFIRYAGIDPVAADADALATRGAELEISAPGLSRREWLDLLFSEAVCRRLPPGRPFFITRFPAEQAALARLCPDDERFAERFEYFIGPLELANGYHELSDAAEQRRRFQADLERRAAAGLPDVPVDERLLAALAAGLPDCSGVALGLDRPLMAAAGVETIEQVMAFPVSIA